jgi:lipoprotein-anchoring transpeptidase ErfK/SrfK
MRAFWFGLLVAGILFWWSPWTKADAAAAPGANAPGAGAGVESMLDGGPSPGAASSPSPSPSPTQPLRITPPAATGVAGLDELLPRLQQREPAALRLGWLALARGAGPDTKTVRDALVPLADDFAAMLAALGPDNSFLHSAEGRGLATKVAQAAFAMSDPEATTAGTQLLDLMLKGRILKEDTAQRALVDDVYKQHRIRVDRWLCDPANVAGARSYTVAKGDSLARIASRFRKEKIQVEEGTLAILNRIHNVNALQVGQKIKVPVAPIRAVVEKRSFSFAVYLGDQLLRLYWIGHGENDRTPNATFTIGVKQPRPDWTSPNGEVHPYGDAGNILGEYFIKFLNDTYVGFGAHGTPMPDTICTMSSMGCIRMYKQDIEELFKLIPMGSKVEVRATESLR